MSPRHSDCMRGVLASSMCGRAATDPADYRDCPGLLDTLLDGLCAAQSLGTAVASEGNRAVLCCFPLCLNLLHYPGHSEEITARLRAAAGSLRFILDHSVSFAADVGVTSGAFAAWFAAQVFGRDEEGDDNSISLEQHHVDDFVQFFKTFLDCTFAAGVYSIPS